MFFQKLDSYDGSELKILTKFLNIYFSVVKKEPELKQEPKSTPVSPEKPKVVVQQVGRSAETEEEPQRANMANGQQPPQTPKDQNQSASNKFIITPDYIQQSKIFF